MEENSQKVIYDDNNFNELISDLKTLTTFSGIASWDKEAEFEIERILKAISEFDNEMSRQTQTLEQHKQAKSEKSFLGRMFSGNKEQSELELLIDKYDHFKITLGKMASQLQESIDFTPNTPEDQKALLKELRQRKKELQVEKREVTAAMKAVKTGARQESADAGKVFGLYYDSKVAASQRRYIRYEKEAALRPHEDAKSAIERQIIQTDRDILWAEKFRE